MRSTIRGLVNLNNLKPDTLLASALNSLYSSQSMKRSKHNYLTTLSINTQQKRLKFGNSASSEQQRSHTRDLPPTGADPLEDMAKPEGHKFIRKSTGCLHNVSLQSNMKLNVILCQQEKVINVLLGHKWERVSWESHIMEHYKCVLLKVAHNFRLQAAFMTQLKVLFCSSPGFCGGQKLFLTPSSKQLEWFWTSSK